MNIYIKSNQNEGKIHEYPSYPEQHPEGVPPTGDS